MKILGICGSPRKGNTEFMLKTVLNRVKELGAQTELILLREKKISHCDGCLSCDKTAKCHIKDDMQDIYPKMLEADVLVFGTPTYYASPSGLFKDFIDRTNPFCVSEQLKSKLVGIIVVGEDTTLKSMKETAKIVKGFCLSHGMKVIGSVLCAGNVAKNKKVIENCKMLAEKIMKIKK